MGTSFCLYKRTLSNRKQVYYCRFLDEDGSILAVRSMKTSNHTLATKKAIKMQPSICSADQQNKPIGQYLCEFWQEDGQYAQRLKRRKKDISPKHMERCRRLIELHVPEEIKKIPMGKFRAKDLETAMEQMAQNGVSDRLINQTMYAIKVGFAEHCRLNSLPNTLISVEKYAESLKQRGCLSFTEAMEVLNPNLWADRRYWFGNLLSAVTGMRMNEVRALRAIDIHENHIDLKHSWDDRSKSLKCPKNGHTRVVPIPPEVYQLFVEFLPEDPEMFIFAGDKPDRPLVTNCFLRALQRIMAECGIDYKDRKIDFHSWRHYASSQISNHVSLKQGMLLTGHLTEKVFQDYASHSDSSDLSAVREAQRKIIDFEGLENSSDSIAS